MGGEVEKIGLTLKDDESWQNRQIRYQKLENLICKSMLSAP